MFFWTFFKNYIFTVRKTIVVSCWDLSELYCTRNEVFIKVFFNKRGQICSSLRIWSHLLKKSLMEKFIFCAGLIMNWFTNSNSPVVRLKDESQNRCYKKTKHAKFSEKQIFLPPPLRNFIGTKFGGWKC